MASDIGGLVDPVANNIGGLVDPMASDIGGLFLRETSARFRASKRLADQALGQLSDEQWFMAPAAESNSLATIVLHMSGNLRSRWRDILTTDGEKPDRDRDMEFAATTLSRQELVLGWDSAWEVVFSTLSSLHSDDLAKTVSIRGQPTSLLGAIQRSLDHSAYHIGQIVYLAKLYTGEQWQNLSIPRGQSQQFTQALLDKSKS
jgi:uncharacterized damage-inducible protein DinB